MRRRPMHCNSRRAPAFSLAISAALVALVGCKRRAPEPQPSASASAAPAPVAAAPRCVEAHPGKSFTLGERSNDGADAGDDEDDGLDQPALPFAVELGRALPFGDGFAVSALSTVGGKTRAVVALLDAEVGAGKVVELGTLHGDPDPPELAGFESELVALVHDTDAGGELLKLAAVRPGPDKPSVVLGAEIAESRDESRVAGLELGPERGVAIWDEWSLADKHGVIVTASFARKDLSNVTKKRIVSLPSEDAEAPRISRRPGGFWAAWISRSAGPKAKAAAPKAAAPKAAAPKALPSASASAEAPEPALVELGERWVSAVPLDANGVAISEPKPITPKNAHVLVFDLATGPDGTLLFSWRNDDSAPGTEERQIHLGSVKPDGTVERHLLDDAGPGVGVPAILVDDAPKDPAAAQTWLSLASVSDATRLGALGPSGTLLDSLAAEPVVRSGELIALARGRMLLARPRGMAMELGLVECKPGPAPLKDAGAD